MTRQRSFVAVIVLALLNVLSGRSSSAILAPISVIPVAIATLVWQVVSFLLLDPLVAGLVVDGSWAAALHRLVRVRHRAHRPHRHLLGRRRRLLSRRRSSPSWRTAGRTPSSTDKPGVVIVQIDGLAQPILAHQIRAGRVPFMARWLRSTR